MKKNILSIICLLTVSIAQASYIKDELQKTNNAIVNIKNNIKKTAPHHICQ